MLNGNSWLANSRAESVNDDEEDEGMDKALGCPSFDADEHLPTKNLPHL